MPVPRDGAADVLPDAALMFLPGRGAASHAVYLRDASAASFALACELVAPANICELPAASARLGARYEWYVETRGADGSTTHVGDVWSFEIMTTDFAVSLAPTDDACVNKNAPDTTYGTGNNLYLMSNSAGTTYTYSARALLFLFF